MLRRRDLLWRMLVRMLCSLMIFLVVARSKRMKILLILLIQRQVNGTVQQEVERDLNQPGMETGITWVDVRILVERCSKHFVIHVVIVFCTRKHVVYLLHTTQIHVHICSFPTSDERVRSLGE